MTRSFDGVYEGTLVGAFPQGKTIVFCNGAYLTGLVECNYYTSADVVTIRTTNIGSVGTEDGVLDKTSIKIEVYQ